MRDKEVETDASLSEDGTEFTIKLKAPEGKLTISDLVLELEYLVHELSKAEEEKARPGVQTH